jgi:hypothetical protein
VVTIDLLPRATILKRTVVGHSLLGDRVMGWEEVVTDLPVSLLEAREEIIDGIVMIRVKAVAADPKVDLPSTISIRFQKGHEPYDELDVYRVTSVSQNGMTVAIEGERVVDGE